MQGTYDFWLVAASYLVAVVASYAALELGVAVTSSPRRTAWIWLACGSIAMGLGIWSMHFIGMLAFHLPIPLAYDVPLTLLSVVPAILSSALVLSATRVAMRIASPARAPTSPPARKPTRTEDLAHRDGLTGLANRVALTQRLDDTIEAAVREQRRFGVMLLDLWPKVWRPPTSSTFCGRAAATRCRATISRVRSRSPTSSAW